MLNVRVLLFWIVTLLEVAERLSSPGNTSFDQNSSIKNNVIMKRNDTAKNVKCEFS
jgi:hypothetical protein